MSVEPRPPASGWQILVLVFAFAIVGTAAETFVFAGLSSRLGIPLGAAITFLAAAAVLLGVPPLRRTCLALLAVPLRPAMAAEIAAAWSLQMVCGFGILGAMALWWWSTGGEPALARHMGAGLTPADPWQAAFTRERLVYKLVLGVLLAPVVEELVFRGLLYRAWERRWGWPRAAVLTSIAFALVHPYVVPQFFASLIMICLLRRTGSLQACIVCHAAMNLALWYPLLGQFLAPGSRESGGLSAWTLHLACLLVGSFGLAIYLWMSRSEATGARKPMFGDPELRRS